MTKEEKDLKDLLLKDICARLPYGVKIHIGKTQRIEEFGDINLRIGAINNTYADVRPYLFPLSSMTEEQKEELNRVTNGKFNSYGTYIDNCKPRNWNGWGTTEYNWIRHHDVDLLNTWLDKNYFDHRGLIEKGLAIDATGLNIYKEE